jgi:hydrogenase maturation protease
MAGLTRTCDARHSSVAGVAEAIALGGALDRAPDRLVVYTIEGADFGEGPGLSCEVEAAVAEVATRVLRDLTR